MVHRHYSCSIEQYSTEGEKKKSARFFTKKKINVEDKKAEATGP